ncbi:glycoside hydrolase domain-containing protein, partial [Planctomycetota bacterium]
PIKNIKAQIGELKQEKLKIVLRAPRVRYPRADVEEGGGKTFPGEGCPVKTLRFDSLHDTPPGEVPVKSLTYRQWKKLTPEQAPWVGAVQTVWLTVQVPDATPPGTYRGDLVVTLDGSDPLNVPVVVKVHDFRIPDPKDLRTWVDFVEAPDNLAVKYNVGLWTEEHWKLVEESMQFLAEVRNKTLYIPLICRTNHSNEQTMVRWARQKDGTFDYDLGPMERYIDLALKAGLAPEAIIFQVWDYHIGRDPTWKIGTGMYGQTTVNTPQQIPVTMLDPVTGRLAEHMGPTYMDAGIEAFWRPVAEKIMESMKKRGLDEKMMLGLSGDYVPPKECVLLWAKFWPGKPWAAVAHGGAKDFYGVPIGYGVSVLWRKFATDPDLERHYGWQNPNMHALFDRYKGGRHAQIAFDRIAAEISITSYLRGPGRMALDSFVWRSRFSSTYWGSISLPRALLAAGPKGPVSTCRFEMLREGVQECEARIVVEEVLLDEALRKKLGEEKAVEFQKMIDERTRCVIWSDETNTNGKNHSSLPLGPLGFDWYAGSDWEGRLDKLFAAAAICQQLNKQ